MTINFPALIASLALTIFVYTFTPLLIGILRKRPITFNKFRRWPIITSIIIATLFAITYQRHGIHQHSTKHYSC